jgi:hypothetical protein
MAFTAQPDATKTPTPAAGGGTGGGGGGSGGQTGGDGRSLWEEMSKRIAEVHSNFANVGNELFRMNPELVQHFEDMIRGEQNRKDPNEINPFAAAIMGFANPQIAQNVVQQRHAEVMQSFNNRMTKIQQYREKLLEARYEQEMAARNYRAAAKTTEEMQQVALLTAEASQRATAAENQKTRDATRQNLLTRLGNTADAVRRKVEEKMASIGDQLNEEDRKQFMDFWTGLSKMEEFGLQMYADNPNLAFDKAWEFFKEYRRRVNRPLPETPAANGTGGGGGGTGGGWTGGTPDPNKIADPEAARVAGALAGKGPMSH